MGKLVNSFINNFLSTENFANVSIMTSQDCVFFNQKIFLN